MKILRARESWLRKVEEQRAGPARARQRGAKSPPGTKQEPAAVT